MSAAAVSVIQRGEARMCDDLTRFLEQQVLNPTIEEPPPCSARFAQGLNTSLLMGTGHARREAQ